MGSSTNRVADAATDPEKRKGNAIKRVGLLFQTEKISFFQFIERRLIGNFDSADFSDPWKRKFAHAPTWCDADMAMQQIQLVRNYSLRIE